MKITYIASDPLKYPRISKIAYSLNKRHDVQFYVMVPRIRVIWLGSMVKRVMSAIINYTTIMLQIFFVKSDVFWVANSPDILVLPLIIRRKRYILEYRSPWSIEVETEFGSGPWARLAAVVEHIALIHASLVTLTNRRLREKTKKYRKTDFVIPNYPLKTFLASIPRREFRDLQKNTENQAVILFVGRLSSHEGVDLLPEILAQVLEKERTAVFWIVGDGPLYTMLHEFSKRKSDGLRLFGWQPHDTIPNFINAADVCIMLMHKSQYSTFYNEEGVQKLSEYMFFRKPIVACGIAESSEYLLVDEKDMANGILKAVSGKVKPSRRKTWEACSEKKIFEMINKILPHQDN